VDTILRGPLQYWTGGSPNSPYYNPALGTVVFCPVWWPNLRLYRKMIPFFCRLLDARDLAKYTVQVVHSAPMLLSMILVYGKDQRLLAMSHLISADSLPTRDQLDQTLQFLPHLSSPDERAMVIVNKDGDCGFFHPILPICLFSFQLRLSKVGGQGSQEK
jgi:hypothetical protein